MWTIDDIQAIGGTPAQRAHSATGARVLRDGFELAWADVSSPEGKRFTAWAVPRDAGSMRHTFEHNGFTVHSITIETPAEHDARLAA